MLNSHRLLILVAFTLSGCAGLIYESVWSHYLGLYLGHAAYAQTLTLTLFMGGLTIGSLITGKFTLNIKNALMGYAVAELILGISGIVFHQTYAAFVSFSYDTALPFLESPVSITAYKWISGATLILPQSIILGATFPLLCSALIRREGNGSGKHISTLYFCNSIGAASGAIIATFFLIPAVGMPGAVLTSGVINIVIALVTYYISKTPESPATLKEETQKSASTSSLIPIALIASAMTGAVSFMYEIAWIRMLNLVLGSSLHAFEIMLSAFIAGLAFGGLWIRNRVDKIENLLRYSGLVQICMGLAAISTLILYVESFDWVSSLLLNTLQPTKTAYTFYNLATSLISGLIMIPATFCAGMTLPLLTTHLIRSSGSESSIGKIYASNTLGAIIGVAFAVHIGMTSLGLKGLLIFAGAIDVALGIYLIYKAPSTKESTGLPIKVALALLLVAAIQSILTPLSPSRLASGTYRNGSVQSSDILFYKDGKTASISVAGANNGRIANISTNGKPDAALRLDKHEPDIGATPDESTMVLLAALPMLIHDNIVNASNIGFGSGLSSHAMLSSHTLKNLDTIEIEPVMVEAAKHFTSRNSNAYNDPRSHIHYEDAKTFFAAQSEKYDVITSEPSNPWVIGVGNLFTTEFYNHIKRYLNDEGLFIQWLQLYEISTPTLLTALGALDSAFPQYQIYAANSGDLIIVAAKEKNTSLALGNTWGQLPPKLKEELEAIGIDGIDHISTRKFADKDSISALLKAIPTPQNSDYFPLLSLNAPQDRFTHTIDHSIFNLLKNIVAIDSSFDYGNLYPSFSPDLNHPFVNLINDSRSLEVALLDDKRELLPPLFQSTLFTLKNPNRYCASKQLAEKWLADLFTTTIRSNYYASPKLRKELLAISHTLKCEKTLPPGAKAILKALRIALSGINEKSTAALRESLHIPLSVSQKEFLTTLYFLSLKQHPANIKPEDVSNILKDFDNLNFTNKWIAALLTEHIIKKD